MVGVLGLGVLVVGGQEVSISGVDTLIPGRSGAVQGVRVGDLG